MATLLGLALTEPLQAIGTSRGWTDREGRGLTASILKVDVERQTIELKRDDGLAFTLQWQELSTSDNDWIKDYLETIDRSAAEAISTAPAVNELPETFELKNVPMVKQKGNYCVPASAAMIAGFHGLETDQDEVAQLSSEALATNQGTYPSDMLLAMGKLGFNGERLQWEHDHFESDTLPRIRRALVEMGPIYISFKPNVFGTMGHGCVIIGYDDRREEMTFHNPWGDVFTMKYDAVAVDGYGVVLIDPPQAAPTASDGFIESLQKAIPTFTGDFLQLTHRLHQASIDQELVWCSRRDSRNDQRFAKDTARRDGRKILELAFERNPAVLIPSSPKGKTEAYYFVTRPPEGGANFMVHAITQSGWNTPTLKTLGSLTREWTTAFTIPEQTDPVWELPMIELHAAE